GEGQIEGTLGQGQDNQQGIPGRVAQDTLLSMRNDAWVHSPPTTLASRQLTLSGDALPGIFSVGRRESLDRRSHSASWSDRGRPDRPGYPSAPPSAPAERSARGAVYFSMNPGRQRMSLASVFSDRSIPFWRHPDVVQEA